MLNDQENLDDLAFLEQETVHRGRADAAGLPTTQHVLTQAVS